MKGEPKMKPKNPNGFTLTELLVAVGIIGILSSVTVPSYIDQVDQSRQRETASAIAGIQTTIAAYADEFGQLPDSWAELNGISVVMTNNGPATQQDFNSITLPGEYYKARIETNTGNRNLFTIIADHRDKEKPNLNIIACINLNNGASAINQGTKAAAAAAPNCG